ncbi:MAG: hypothetical protein GX660_08060 [Clostridiaceae bacterium]|nr:hypothetical protein [Clostridiaceae bacterium]
MKYPIEEDFIFIPVEATEEQTRAANLIHNITGVKQERLLNCICHYGVDKVLSNPEVLGVSIQDQQKISDLRELLTFLNKKEI